MQNSHLRNKRQNLESSLSYSTMLDERVERKDTSILQFKDRVKSEIKLTRQQLNELTQLFKDYAKKKPGWLRQSFLINQRRRKLLNNVLADAGCDVLVCGTLSPGSDWFYSLHAGWHLINNQSLCAMRRKKAKT